MISLLTQLTLVVAVAFLQLVGVGDGPASQIPAASSTKTTVKTLGLSNAVLVFSNWTFDLYSVDYFLVRRHAPKENNS